METEEQTSRINNQLEEQLNAFSPQLEHMVRGARNDWKNWLSDARGKGMEMGRQVDGYVRGNTWQALCGAMAAGVVLGLVLGRSSGD